MNKADNMKQAMHEMFGVGKGAEKSSPAAAEGKAKSTAAAPTTTIIAPSAPRKVPEPAASFLAEGTSFEGTLRAKGDVEIAGEFKGTVAAEGAVRLRSNVQSSISAKSVELHSCVLTGDIKAGGIVAVSEGSKVVGNVSARELLCAGEIVGDLKVTESVRLDAKACISGGIVTGAISVERGASISGNVQIRTPAAQTTPQAKAGGDTAEA